MSSYILSYLVSFYYSIRKCSYLECLDIYNYHGNCIFTKIPTRQHMFFDSTLNFILYAKKKNNKKSMKGLNFYETVEHFFNLNLISGDKHSYKPYLPIYIRRQKESIHTRVIQYNATCLIIVKYHLKSTSFSMFIHPYINGLIAQFDAITLYVIKNT